MIDTDRVTSRSFYCEPQYWSEMSAPLCSMTGLNIMDSQFDS